MTDTARLEEIIEASGYKKKFLAQALGIALSTLSRKISNVLSFNAQEIQTLCQLLGITDPKDVMAIFFAGE